LRADEQRHAVANANFAEEQQPERANGIAVVDVPAERGEADEAPARRDAA
jgi:hypothetical protein